MQQERERQVADVLERYRVANANNNGSQPSSAASLATKTLNKIVNFPENGQDEPGLSDEYVFDKHQHVWRTKDASTPSSKESPTPSTDFKPNYFFYKGKGSRSRNKQPARHFAIVDFLLLASEGILMALLSFAMDLFIHGLQHQRQHLMHALEGLVYARFALWVLYGTVLIAASASFCRYFGPQAIGSGIPEMKTIIRGVMLKEYLTLRTLIAKIVGLMLSLSSGAPVGKEGPFVHIGSVLAHQLARCARSVSGVYGNESRRSEMLAAGCAVGIACTFSSPVGGVLYSIEATSVYFGMRNYKRCFLAAICSATVFRILQLSSGSKSAVVALYQTNFPKNCYVIEELPLFVLLGLICGVVAAIFIYIQRNFMYFIRGNCVMKKITNDFWILYPVLVMVFFASVTFPDGIGRFVAGERLFGETVRDFFGNCSWTLGNVSSAGCSPEQLGIWSNYGQNEALTILSLFFVMAFVFVTICSTLPVPLGAFVPSFVIGSAMGRLFGEGVLFLFPERAESVYPGIYAVVGAAAFCAGATHSVSVAVVLYEVTGQLTFTIPILIGVLVAHATCKHLQMSLYDSIVQIKKLPYLKDIQHISQDFIGITADQFMTTDVFFLSGDSTLADVRELLMRFSRVRTFPVCDSHKNRILLGSIAREQLTELVHRAIGHKASVAEFARRLNKRLSLDTASKASIGSSGCPSPGNGPDTKISFSPDGATDSVPSSKAYSVPHSRTETEALLSTDPEDSKSLSGKLRSITRGLHKFKGHGATGGLLDLSSEERKVWERERLQMPLDVDALQFDAAPFQLMERAPLLHIHMIFSLLSLNRAYITKCGRLEGLVTMRDLRLAIEAVKHGQLFAREWPGQSIEDSPFFRAHKKPELEFKI